MTSKERCLAAIAGQPVDRVPVFPLLMFFSADRAGITYRKFASDGASLARAQLLIRERFGIDAITACSDAFRVSGDLGGEMIFPDDRPPYLARPIVRDESDLTRIGRPDPTRPGSRMADRCNAVSIMSRAAGSDCLVLGWVDMPFAEACSICGVSEFMLMLVDRPKLAHAVLDRLAEIVIDFAVAQVNAGAAMIGAGDAAASLISPAMYREFALPREQRVCQAVHDAGGLIKLHICGNTSALIPDMISSGADLFNVDHMVDFRQARDAYSAAGRCFKGNINPVDLLTLRPDAASRRARELIELAAGTPYMLSPGCEIPAAVPDEVFAAFCEAPEATG